MKSFAKNLVQLRKQYRFTQEQLAQKLNISFQAISKWETGQSYPDINQLPKIADIFNISIDNLVGHIPHYKCSSQYDEFYKSEKYYWGIEPSSMCYEVLKLKPPIKPWKVLDIGCGEGKDSVFFARNGCDVTAMDISDIGLEKAEKLANFYHVSINLLKADITNFKLTTEYDIIFSSGVLHYISQELRATIVDNYKEFTAKGGINILNVFVKKPFIKTAPDEESPNTLWKSGELATYYHDWYFHKMNEMTFDCNSSNIPHKHCMDYIIVQKF